MKHVLIRMVAGFSVGFLIGGLLASAHHPIQTNKRAAAPCTNPKAGLTFQDKLARLSDKCDSFSYSWDKFGSNKSSYVRCSKGDRAVSLYGEQAESAIDKGDIYVGRN
jgi:hypothetical protein